MKYLVRWNPYQVLRTLQDDETCSVPEGCDIIRQPLYDIEKAMAKWTGRVDWAVVLKLYDEGNYLEIFKLHNNHHWSTDHYCCERHHKNVEYNVGLYKNS